MDLIPFYARLVATLTPCMEDLAPMLVDILVHDFRFQVRKKDQIHIYFKIKNCHLIGELVCRGEYCIGTFPPFSLPPSLLLSLPPSLSPFLLHCNLVLAFGIPYSGKFWWVQIFV